MDLAAMIADFEKRGGKKTVVPQGRRAYTEAAMARTSGYEPDGQLHYLVRGLQETGEPFSIKLTAEHEGHAEEQVRMRHPEWSITGSRPAWVGQA